MSRVSPVDSAVYVLMKRGQGWSNHTRRCSMCEFGRPDLEMVRSRVHLGDPEKGVRVAVCPIHDVAGPVENYPPGLQTVVNAPES